jgi:UDP-N-acetylglucosamine 2-epimerase (non-hydrolysing)
MISIVFGTRPEWIKIKPVVDKINGIIPYRLICTGQHSSLIDQSITNYNVEYLTIQSDGKNRLDNIVASTLNNSEHILQGSTSVMVQGDTTSAFAVALAAFHRKVPIIHLEAGLRSWDINNPYPEEFNRIAISNMASLHLCPTIENKFNLASVSGEKYVVGNTVLDSLVHILPSLEPFVLITLHRRENLSIIDKWFIALENLAMQNTNLTFIFPMHLNPEIQKHRTIFNNVQVIAPLSHAEFIDKLSRCSMVITDSGGIQEESAFLKKKSIVCRQTTERQEGEYLFSQLCHEPDMLQDIFDNTKIELLNEPCPYGDGKSSEKILMILRKFHKP